MKSFQDILRGVEFRQRNGQDIDLNKVVSVTINKRSAGSGHRLVTVARYANGRTYTATSELPAAAAAKPAPRRATAQDEAVSKAAAKPTAPAAQMPASPVLEAPQQPATPAKQPVPATPAVTKPQS